MPIPFFFDSEIHSNFAITYAFNPEFLGELQGFYDTYRLNDVLDVRFRGKRYPLKKFYLFSGFCAEIELDKYRLQPPPWRIELINGFGYDLNEKFTLEAAQDLHFNKYNFGNYGTPNLFSLGGKNKFVNRKMSITIFSGGICSSHLPDAYGLHARIPLSL